MCPSGKESLWGTTSNIVYDSESPKTTPDEIQELLSGAEELFPKLEIINLLEHGQALDLWSNPKK